MRNRLFAIIFALALMLAISAQADSAWECNQCGRRVPTSLGDICPYCGARRHVHTWREATYTEPKTCIECGATEGAPLPPTPKPTPKPTPTPESAGSLYDKGLEAYYSGDYSAAFIYFQQAADLGSRGACIMLGNMYANGDGVEQSYETALQYYQLAADRGFDYAFCIIGEMYLYGEGVEQSFEKFVQYNQLAAEGGFLDAYVYIGLEYEKGDCVEQSFEKAAEYYQMALEQGSSWAEYKLEELREEGYIQ